MENFLRKYNQNHQNNARWRKTNIIIHVSENNFGYMPYGSIGVHIITAIVCADLWQNFIFWKIKIKTTTTTNWWLHEWVELAMELHTNFNISILLLLLLLQQQVILLSTIVFNIRYCYISYLLILVIIFSKTLHR